MNLGVSNRALGAFACSLLLVACGGSDAPTCGTGQTSTQLEVKGVSPALDATVTNANIVETFTIVGQRLKFSAPFVASAAHTAGQMMPTPTQWTLSFGTDTVYTSEPFSWEKAPAHVELDSRAVLQTTDGCLWSLPTTIFRYDVTAP